MNEALHFIRKAIIDRLTNQITVDSATVPVYNRVPSDATAPYIKVFSVSHDEIDSNKDTFTLNCVTRIEAVTSFDADSGGQLTVNQMISSILNLVRTRSSTYFDLSSDNFKVYTCINEGVSYEENDEGDKTYFIGNLELSNRVQKTS